MKRGIPALIAILLYILQVDCITQCKKTTACSCMGDNGMIDLSPLASNGGARFKDISATSGDQFSWNPCKPFTEKGCKNVAACQIQNANPPAYFSIGTQDSAKFQVNKGALTLTYSADTFLGTGPELAPNFLRSAIITLVCDKSVEGTLKAVGEKPAKSGKYLMTLTSKYACESTGGTVTVTYSLSVGSILVIAVVVLSVVYAVGGVSIQKFVRKAEGKEIIPNLNFWSSIPGLIKGGVLFTVRCGKVSRYDQI
ncbi:uncharacterized protein LOC125377817 [Haliotis rufescens]|uniref:uncharacterized protein LOC125377817 n=2 Tax=Haliotis rufescens TaxID=6454 RepID=UPI00201F5E87|nr:uncharacterized protein LOC125377817 [Haliotis rufescens]